MNLSQATQQGNQLLNKIGGQWNSVKRAAAPVNLARASASTYEASERRRKADAKKLLSQVGPLLDRAWSIVAKVNMGQISSQWDMDDDKYWKEGKDYEKFENQLFSYVNSPELKKLQSLAKDANKPIPQHAKNKECHEFRRFMDN